MHLPVPPYLYLPSFYSIFLPNQMSFKLLNHCLTAVCQRPTDEEERLAKP